MHACRSTLEDPTDRRGFVLPAAALGVAVFAAGCGAQPAPDFERPPVPVTAYVATAKDVPVYVDEVGRAAASAVVEVRPEVSGRVTAIPFADGADVKARDPLVTIDPRPFDARLAEAKARGKAAESGVVEARAARDTAAARVATAKSKRDQAKAQTTWAQAMADAARGDATAAEADAARAAEDEKRYQSMGNGAVSQQDLDRVRAEARSATARLSAATRRTAAAVAESAQNAAAERAAEDGIREAESLLAEAEAKIASAEAEGLRAAAAVENAALDVERTTVRAAAAGRAGRRLVDVGDVVEANTTTVVVIQSYDPAYVELSVTERQLSAVQRNMGKRTLKAEVSLPDEPEAREGSLTFLDNAVDPGTGTVRLRVTVPNADGRFWPGRFVRVRLVLDTLKAAVLVPSSATQVSPAGLVVYVVKVEKGESTADLRPVRLGQRQGDLVVVEEGVAAGERVIVDRNLTVFPGAKVRVVESPAQAAPATPGAPGAPAKGEPAR